MTLPNTLHPLDLEVKDDVYWGLIKLGSELKMHHENYAEHVLAAHVKHELDKQASH
jgi:hypothetical protein